MPFCDTNRDGQITPTGDVLPLINRFNREGGGRVSSTDFADVNFDGFFTPIDILCILNHINARPSGPSLRVHITDVDTFGLSDEQSRAAILRGLDWYRKQFNLNIVLTSNNPDITLNTTEVYLGNGVHAGGIFRFPNSISLHNGFIGAFHHSCTRAPCNQSFNFQVFSISSLEKTMVHEVGHFYGLEHIANIDCIMHINAAADDFCGPEITIIQRVLDGLVFGDTEDDVDFVFTP